MHVQLSVLLTLLAVLYSRVLIQFSDLLDGEIAAFDLGEDETVNLVNPHQRLV